MVHLIIFRQARSFVAGKNLIYGTHQQIEKNIDERKYPVNVKRKGYCIPTSCEWNMIDYRIKKDVLPDFTRDLGGTNLNPYPNNITLYKILKHDKQRNVLASVGKVFLIVQWLFKWINRKKTTSLMLFFVGLLTYQLWLWIFIPLILLNPLKPVPVNTNKTCEIFTTDWNSNYIIGYVKDVHEVLANGEVQEDVL